MCLHNDTGAMQSMQMTILSSKAEISAWSIVDLLLEAPGPLGGESSAEFCAGSSRDECSSFRWQNGDHARGNAGMFGCHQTLAQHLSGCSDGCESDSVLSLSVSRFFGWSNKSRLDDT